MYGAICTPVLIHSLFGDFKDQSLPTGKEILEL